jgi:FMN phosphatase YigB (HAD superfamily)
MQEDKMKKIVVFDIDGTLANVDHRRPFISTRPKNWAAWNAAMSRDTVNEEIRWMVFRFQSDPNLRTIICSGRSDDTRDVTENWLYDREIMYDTLYMRKSGDYRQDNIVKVELLQEIRHDYGEPWLWIDDRDQVVKAIRAEGVRVLQVAPGDF